MASKGLTDEEIQQSLFDNEDSEDGFDGDDDSIADPDFVPDLEVPMEVDGLEDVDGVNIDTIFHDTENYVNQDLNQDHHLDLDHQDAIKLRRN